MKPDNVLTVGIALCESLTEDTYRATHGGSMCIRSIGNMARDLQRIRARHARTAAQGWWSMKHTLFALEPRLFEVSHPSIGPRAPTIHVHLAVVECHLQSVVPRTTSGKLVLPLRTLLPFCFFGCTTTAAGRHPNYWSWILLDRIVHYQSAQLRLYR